MTAKTRLLLVNSAVAFAIALLLMITVHEFAHALAGLALGLRPVVFPNQVTYGVAGTARQPLGTAGIGPPRPPRRPGAPPRAGPGAPALLGVVRPSCLTTTRVQR